MEPSSAPWRLVEPAEAAPEPPEPAPRELPWVAVGAVLIALIVAASALLLTRQPDAAVDVEGVASVQPAANGTGDGLAGQAGTSGPLVVEVGGAVLRPGVYRLPAGSRVNDAVSAAGGFGPRVDAALADRQLNLAALLHDGDEIHVPVRGETAGPQAAGGSGGIGSGGAGAPAAGPLDLNHATAEQLDALPGVGPATAAKIIAAREERPFSSVDDVGTRKVLGAATLAKLRPLVTVLP